MMVKPPDFTPETLFNRNSPSPCCAGIAKFAGRYARHNDWNASAVGLLAAASPFATFRRKAMLLSCKRRSAGVLLLTQSLQQP
jgi:hypothetical protein